jgi:hypothetical protein
MMFLSIKKLYKWFIIFFRTNKLKIIITNKSTIVILKLSFKKKNSVKVNKRDKNNGCISCFKKVKKLSPYLFFNLKKKDIIKYTEDTYIEKL